jgi:hypothetical protein
MDKNCMINSIENSQNPFSFYSHFEKKVRIFLGTYHIVFISFMSDFEQNENEKKMRIFLGTYHIVFLGVYRIFKILTFCIYNIFFLRKNENENENQKPKKKRTKKNVRK